MDLKSKICQSWYLVWEIDIYIDLNPVFAQIFLDSKIWFEIKSPHKLKKKRTQDFGRIYLQIYLEFNPSNEKFIFFIHNLFIYTCI